MAGEADLDRQHEGYDGVAREVQLENQHKEHDGVAGPVMVIIAMLTVLIKGGNSEGARLIICIAASLLLAFTILREKHYFSLVEWLPGLAMLGIASLHIFTHNLIWEEALLWGTLAFSYWTIALCVSRFSMVQVRVVLIALLLLASFEVVYGIFNRVSDEVVVVGLWEKLYFLDSATGTFVNRNHYAGYLALTWPISLATITLLTRHQRALRISLSAVLSILFVFGLILSKSRMGLFAGIVGICLYFYWQARRELGLSRKSSLILWGFGVLLLIIAALWIGVGDIGKRYLVLGESFLLRSTVWQSLFDFPIETWASGIGVNQFEQRFPQVQPLQLKPRFIYAHNDYLQVVLEVGIIAVLAAVIAFVIFIKKTGFAHLDTKRRAAWCGIIAVLIQEAADFDLHMPGLAVVFVFLFGLTINHNAYSVRRSRAKQEAAYQPFGSLKVEDSTASGALR